MAAAERRELRAGEAAPLALQRLRELGALVDRYFDAPDAHGVDLALAVVRWAFECGDVGFIPELPQLQREGMLLVPVTPWGDVRPVWIAAPTGDLASSQPAPRRPSLREVGAQPVEGARRG